MGGGRAPASHSRKHFGVNDFGGGFPLQALEQVVEATF